MTPPTEALLAKFHNDSQGRFLGVGFLCPGCGDRHILPIEPTPEGRRRSPDTKGFHTWTWNGSLTAPTFHPSVHVRVGHFVDPDWCECHDNVELPGQLPELSCYDCHSWVRDGKIQFLTDCSHSLAGKTVDLPALE